MQNVKSVRAAHREAFVPQQAAWAGFMSGGLGKCQYRPSVAYVEAAAGRTAASPGRCLMQALARASHPAAGKWRRNPVRQRPMPKPEGGCCKSERGLASNLQAGRHFVRAAGGESAAQATDARVSAGFDGGGGRKQPTMVHCKDNDTETEMAKLQGMYQKCPP